ncbi:MAG: hypothetical protein ACSLEL_02105 [Candidatus Malihini olakiniferum]
MTNRKITSTQAAISLYRLIWMDRLTGKLEIEQRFGICVNLLHREVKLRLTIKHEQGITSRRWSGLSWQSFPYLLGVETTPGYLFNDMVNRLPH